MYGGKTIGGPVLEIILLGMVAVFVGLRLYSVLGQRSGHEQEPAPRPVERMPRAVPDPVSAADVTIEAGEVHDSNIAPAAASGLAKIVSADRSFDTEQFLAGAHSAYKMILEAFWKGDKQELSYLVGDEVGIAFKHAIDARDEEGHVLDNRMVAIERTLIEDAELDRQHARITVRFDADIATVTRDKDDNVVAGSMTDAVPTHDIWTFERNLRDDDPNWLLVETEEAA